MELHTPTGQWKTALLNYVAQYYVIVLQEILSMAFRCDLLGLSYIPLSLKLD